MKIWLSEFTYQRLVAGLKDTIPILLVNEHGHVQVDVPLEVVENAKKNFGLPLDMAINKLINENQRLGLWPKKGDGNGNAA